MTGRGLAHRRPTALFAVVALLLGLGWAVIPNAPAAHAAPVAFNPFAASGDFTIYGREDVTLENQELEGSVAAGEVLRRNGGGNYAVLHVVAGTGNYTIPTVDGDPTRVLADTYSTSSGGILYVSSAGTSEPSLLGDVKLVERDNSWQFYPRGDWLRLANGGSPDSTPVIDAVHQDYPGDSQPPTGESGNGSIYTVDTAAGAVARYVEANAESTWEEAQECLAAIADPSSAIGNVLDAGDVAVGGVVATLSNLAPDRPNVVPYELLGGANRIAFAANEPTPGAQNPLIIRVAAGTTSVAGVSIDPQGAYSPYTMWDLSAVTGAVSIGVPGTRMDGSVYAPEADVSVSASPLDGQIIGENVTVQGGEVHSFLFSSDVSCLDQFRVQKVVEGIDAGDLPDGFTFTLNYTATLPSGDTSTGTLELPADGSWVVPEELYPVGTVITFAEVPPETVPGYEWADPVISPASITIGEGDGTIDVTVTNAVTQPTGTFTLSKAITDGDPSTPDPTVDGTVPVTWTAVYDGEQIGTGTIELPLDGTVVGPDPAQDFPIGTQITLQENLDGVDPPAGYEWNAAGWLPSRTFTIGSTDGVEATLFNYVVPQDEERSITVIKSTEGDPGAASDAYQYAVGYNTDAGNTTRTARSIFVGDPVTLLDFPEGPDADTLYLSELLPLLNSDPVDPANWADPVFVVDGTTYEPGGFGLNEPVAEIDVSGSEDVVVEVVNQRLFGTFEVSKLLEGIDPSDLPEGTEFTVAWTANLPEGDTERGVLRLPADGTPVSPTTIGGESREFPFGTTIDLSELEPPALRSTEWGAPVFDPEQLVIGADGAATVTATVTNSATLATGTFAVTKSFNGIDAGQVSGDAATVAYVAILPDRTATAGTLQVPFDGTPASPVDDSGDLLEFPIGTSIALIEQPIPDDALPPGYEWASPTWTPGRAFTITGGGETIEVGLVNSVEQLAQFSVEKLVEGSGAGDIPPGTEFTVDWWLDDEAQEPLVVTPGETTVSIPVPVNSLVEVAEAEPLPETDGTWQQPVWVGPDGGTLEPETNGRVIVPMSVGPDDTVALQLVNTVDEEPTPSPSTSVPTPSPSGPTVSPTTPGQPGLPGTGTDGVPIMIAIAAGLLAVGLTLWGRARRAR